MLHLRKMLKKRKGFTLIELIVVLAILAIIALLAIPKFLGTLDRANWKTHMANIRTIESAISLYRVEEGTAPADNAALANYIETWPTEPGTYSVTAGVLTASPTKAATITAINAATTPAFP